MAKHHAWHSTYLNSPALVIEKIINGRAHGDSFAEVVFSQNESTEY